MIKKAKKKSLPKDWTADLLICSRTRYQLSYDNLKLEKQQQDGVEIPPRFQSKYITFVKEWN
jgi:hypothetical protein